MLVGFVTPLQLTVTDWPPVTLAGLAVRVAVAPLTVMVLEVARRV